MSCWTYHSWWLYQNTRHQLPHGLKIVSILPGPMLPIELLRSQCEVVPTDTDTDGVDSHPDDALLLAYLEAAIEHAEDFTGLSVALKTYDLSLDGYPGSWGNRAIELPRAPLISVESFTALAGGSDGELDLGDDFTLDDFRIPARLLPVTSWPSMISSSNAIRIRFLAGYQTDTYSSTDYAGATTLPAVIRQALLLLVGHFYANREDTVEKAISTIPNGFRDLLRPRQIELGMA